MHYFTDLFVILWINTKNKLSAWITVLILLLTFMRETVYQRKSLKLWVCKGKRKDIYGNDSFSLMIINNGSLPLGIRYYGYKRWDGGMVKNEYISTIHNYRYNPEEDPIELSFYDSIKGINTTVNEKDIYYYFVETSGGYIKRKYTCLRLKSWFKRLLIVSSKKH